MRLLGAAVGCRLRPSAGPVRDRRRKAHEGCRRDRVRRARGPAGRRGARAPTPARARCASGSTPPPSTRPTPTSATAPGPSMQQADPPPYVPGHGRRRRARRDRRGRRHRPRGRRPRDGHRAAEGLPRRLLRELVVPAESVARVPAGATRRRGVDAAHERVHRPAGPRPARRSQPGQTLAVTGAAGCFGGYMVQLAKADGLRVIADASPADEQLVREARRRRGGRPRATTSPPASARWCPDGVDGLADGSVQNDRRCSAAIGRRGVRHRAGLRRRRRERGITIHPVWVREYPKEQAKLDRLRQQVEDGAVTLRVARTFPAPSRRPRPTACSPRAARGGGLVIEL